jgi:CRP/FNR family transcriptional regulator, cyclic AMP receptor protein
VIQFFFNEEPGALVKKLAQQERSDLQSRADLLALLDLRMGQSALFSGLPEEVRRSISASAAFRTFQRGEVLAHELSTPSQMILLLRGSVEVSRLMEGGNRIVFRSLYPPSGIGYLRLAGQPHTADVVAADGTVVALIPLPVLKRLFDQHPELLYKVVAWQAGMVDELSSELIEQRTLSLRDRLEAAIRRNADTSGELRMSHEELAQLVGATRSNVTRALKELSESGGISMGRRVIRLRRQNALR